MTTEKMLYFSEEVVEFVGVQFLDFAYLLRGSLPRDRRRAAVEQYPQPIQSIRGYQTTENQWGTRQWSREVEKRSHEAAASEFARDNFHSPLQRPFFTAHTKLTASPS